MSKFTDSCAPVDYPCAVGTKFIIPCSCTAYFECQVGGYSFIRRKCGLGTAWDHRTGFCDIENKIYIANGTPICEREEPWLRCDAVPGHYDESRLEDSCDDSTTPSNNGSGSGGSGGSGGSDDTGAIVGGVVGGLLVIVLVVVLALWWKKRQGDRSKKSTLQFRPSVQKPSKEMEEEVYDVIDEKSVVPGVTNMAYNQQQTEYDNPAFSAKSAADDNDYANLKQQSPHHHPHGQQQQQQEQEPTTSFNYLNPEVSTRADSGRGQDGSRHTFDDLSRSISVGGRDIVVEDAEGYHVGYPSGSVPRQPSPLPPLDGDDDEFAGDDPGYGYELGKAHEPNNYYELEKTDL